MERFEDQGIVLSVRPHGENGGIVSLLTENHGRHAGYVRGVSSSKMRGTLEAGNTVDVQWNARVSDNLGSYALELRHNPTSSFLQDALRLGALQAACALCDEALPEREGHAGLYYGLKAMFDALESEIWAETYVMWELAFLRELGFSLELTKCAGGGDAQDLTYVSPKTGRAVSKQEGAPYKDKLLKMPEFLKPNGQSAHGEMDVFTGLNLTGYFLEHWVFAHHTRGVPQPRLRFASRFAKTLEHSTVKEESEEDIYVAR